jgi:DNA mismatch repair ATPase MutS
LRQNARIGDELDVAVALATLADEMKWVPPKLDDRYDACHLPNYEPLNFILSLSTSYHVVNGRHPTVELGLLKAGRNFVPNTVWIHPGSRLHIITGPNMAGKNTLITLRISSHLLSKENQRFYVKRP